jgi:flagellar assembly protein FliH
VSGEAEMREKTRLALEPIRHLALGFATALNSLDVEMGDQLAGIALKIGKQLALDGIKQHPEAVLSVVRAVLHSDPEMIGKPRLRVNPEDAEMIINAFGSEIEALGWKVIPDDQISRGGCKVLSTHGEIDATWESRWASIQQEFHREKAGE